MFSTIVFTGLILAGIYLLIVYNYIALWRIPRETENREKLGWCAMLYSSIAIFCLLLAWRLKEPLAKDFLPVFFILSLIAGFLARESAMSSYTLAKFWVKPKVNTGKDFDKKDKGQ